jgi:radical SAM superfamily enzyme YgiQ (UPF0313 family)
MQAARETKRRKPNALIIIGGPEIPKYIGETERFLEESPFIDIAVLGEGEVACADILETFLRAASTASYHFADIPRIAYRQDNDIVRTAERQRIADVNSLPSPYLGGEFGSWFEDFSTTALETNRGCPYSCTYCDWGSATLQKVTRFDPRRVIEEIEYIAQKRSQIIFIADANFGMLEQDIEISEALVDVRKRTGYPSRLYTNFAKNGGRRLMAVMKILHEGGLLPTGIIALQTTDEQVLKTIKRDNIKTANYEKMMAYFNAENIPMASDIMIGLPGQTTESLIKDLQFCFDWKVSANCHYTTMMPNAPMAEKSYRKEHRIVTDENGMIASTATFSREDMRHMLNFYTSYEFFVRLGVLKYYLYHLQIEHQVLAMDILRLWIDSVTRGAENLSISRRLCKEILAPEDRASDWD